MKLKSIVSFACVLFCARSGAQVPIVTATTGAGANESYFVINFDDGAGFTDNPASDYVFGYRWNYGAGNSAPTAADLINALTAPGTGVGLSATESTFSFGTEVDSFSYGGHSQTGDYALNQSYWNYWTTTGARLAANSSDWDSSFVGITDRTLAPDSFDGWTFSAFGDSPVPNTPMTPEPGTIAYVAAVCCGALLARRRRARMCPR